RLEETRPMSMTNRPIWSRPSVLLAALAASVAIAFTAGYLTHARLTPANSTGELDLAANHRPPINSPALPPEPKNPVPDGAKQEGSEAGGRGGEGKPDHAIPSAPSATPVPSPVIPPPP